MSSNIILNKSNISNLNQGNNSLVYEFPSDIQFKNTDSIAISSLNLYYSWFNITTKNNNNFFQYKFFNENNNCNYLMFI